MRIAGSATRGSPPTWACHGRTVGPGFGLGGTAQWLGVVTPNLWGMVMVQGIPPVVQIS